MTAGSMVDEDKLHEAVECLYDKLVADPELAKFFVGMDMDIIKWHQLNIVSMAFTKIPEEMDVAQLVIENRHEALFKKGLTERHFEIVMTHLVDTLHELKFDAQQIEHAKKTLSPFRPVFQRIAAQRRVQLQTRAAIVVGVVATVKFCCFVVDLGHPSVAVLKGPSASFLKILSLFGVLWF